MARAPPKRAAATTSTTRKCQQQQHHDSDERKPRVKGTISCKHKEQYDSDSDDQGHAKKKPKIHTTSPTEKDHKIIQEGHQDRENGPK